MPRDPNSVREPDVISSLSETRMSLCRDCEHFILKQTICSKCGCLMSLKVKLKRSRCPIGKWGPEE